MPVFPGSDSEFKVAFEANGKEVGFNLFTDDDELGFRERETAIPPPLDKVGIESFHMGRGQEIFIPNSYGFKESKDAWTTTPRKAHATIKPRWAKGIRSFAMNMPDSVTFKPLTGSTRALSVSFSDSAGFTASFCVLIIRKMVKAGVTGLPGTLTVEWTTNSGSDPNTVLKTVTLSASEVDDVDSRYIIFTPSSTQALSAATTYHIKVYGASTDNKDAHWEVACDTSAAGRSQSDPAGAAGTWSATTYSPAFRICDAEIDREWFKFHFDGVLYAVSKNVDATASKLYLNGLRGKATSATSTTLTDSGQSLTTDRYAGAFIRIIRGTGAGQIRQIASNTSTAFTVAAWSVTPSTDSEYAVYSTDWWFEVASAFSAQVVSKPIVAMGIVYFPMGDGTQFRTMTLDYTDADDHVFDNQTTSRADKFVDGFDAALGPLMWRANNITGTGSGGKSTISAAQLRPSGSPVAYTTDLSFATAIPSGDNTNLINNLILHENNVFVVKEDSLYQIVNNQPVQVRLGIEAAPSIYNGLAAVSKNGLLYLNFGHDVLLVTGGQGYSTGLHKEGGIPSARSGVMKHLEAVLGWIFGAYDAGTGTSTIMMYATQDQTWREHLRAFAAGKRIRSLRWQPCPESRPRLWFEVGGDLMYQEFPKDDIRPLNDSGVAFMHEFGIEFPRIDLLNTDPKYFGTIFAVVEGLAQTGDSETGHEFWIEYKTDTDTTWQHGGSISRSPSGEVKINRGNKRFLWPRVRGVTTEATDPVVLNNLQVSLFTRTTYRYRWTLYIRLSTYLDDDAQKKLEWLIDQSQKATTLKMTSQYLSLHNKTVTIARKPAPSYEFSSADSTSAVVVLELEEVI
jgi:hypothetical protein